MMRNLEKGVGETLARADNWDRVQNSEAATCFLEPGAVAAHELAHAIGGLDGNPRSESSSEEM